jgi:hypothetical protein
MENISSEEELLQLRNEGKISEDEYKQLHAAMRNPSPDETGVYGKPEVCPVKTEFRAFRKRVFVTGMIICVIAMPVGFILNIPLVWGLGIFGIIVIPLKVYLLDRWHRNQG